MVTDDLEAIVARVRAHTPVVDRRGHRRGLSAATALVLHRFPELGVHVLFVQRTERLGDRWSGQMALPGGRRDPGDRDLVATARREALEEVGIELGDPVGRLDDVGGRTSPAMVATYVFTVDREPRLVPDPAEVAATVWIPLRHLVDPAAATRTWYRGVGPFPAVRYGDHVVWGLTYRIVRNLLTVLSAPR